MKILSYSVTSLVPTKCVFSIFTINQFGDFRRIRSYKNFWEAKRDFYQMKIEKKYKNIFLIHHTFWNHA